MGRDGEKSGGYESAIVLEDTVDWAAETTCVSRDQRDGSISQSRPERETREYTDPSKSAEDRIGSPGRSSR